MWRNGWAQAYGVGWEERLKVLKDDSVKNPVFTPLNYVELLMYTDLQPVCVGELCGRGILWERICDSRDQITHVLKDNIFSSLLLLGSYKIWLSIKKIQKQY